MRARSRSLSVSGPGLSQMSSTTPARPMSCRCPARRTAFASASPCRSAARPASAATPAEWPRVKRDLMSAYCPMVAIAVSSASPDRRTGSPGSAASSGVVHRRHLQRGEQLGRVTAEHLDQLRVVAVAGARAHQRDGLVGAEQAARRLRVGGELHQPHRALDRLALELSRLALPVPALEHLRHRVRDTRRQAQPLGEQPADLAVPARVGGHAGQLAERAHHLAHPPRQGARCGRCWRPSRAASRR